MQWLIVHLAHLNALVTLRVKALAVSKEDIILNIIKDFLGIRRNINVRVYGVGYMGNAFIYRDITINNSIRFINKYGLDSVVLGYLNKNNINFPRAAFVIL